MNRKRFGKYPKIMALFLALVMTFTGCMGQDTPIASDSPGSMSYDAFESDDTQSTDSSSESSSVSASDIPGSVDKPPDSTSDSSDSDNPDISDPPVSDPSTQSSSASSSTDNSGGGSSESSSSSTSNHQSSGGSGSSQQSGSSSTSNKTDPPPVVVIPDIAVPTSPGTKLVTAKNGVVDYSNADKGYISAKYTGDSAKCKLQIKANGEEYNFDVTVGGKTEYFPLSMGNGHYTVMLCELVQGSTYAVVLRQEIDVTITNPRSPYTYSNRYVNYDKNSQCVYTAAELCAGKTGTIDKIAAIFQWVTENISYDYNLAATVTKGYTPDPDTTMKKKTGICFDYASLMAAMLRSQGIPTRLVIGDASPNIYHAWTEIYTEQTGWITPELMLKNNGYNIVDATFYSTANNKKQIADYISNTANYYATYYY